MNDYTYLGIKITSTGNFALAEETQYFVPKLLGNFLTLVKTIVLYNSEVWGAYSEGNFGIWDKSPVEKVHLRFCKIYPGVNSKCSNDACRAELMECP